MCSNKNIAPVSASESEIEVGLTQGHERYVDQDLGSIIYETKIEEIGKQCNDFAAAIMRKDNVGELEYWSGVSISPLLPDRFTDSQSIEEAVIGFTRHKGHSALYAQTLYAQTLELCNTEPGLEELEMADLCLDLVAESIMQQLFVGKNKSLQLKMREVHGRMEGHNIAIVKCEAERKGVIAENCDLLSGVLTACRSCKKLECELAGIKDQVCDDWPKLPPERHFCCKAEIKRVLKTQNHLSKVRNEAIRKRYALESCEEAKIRLKEGNDALKVDIQTLLAIAQGLADEIAEIQEEICGGTTICPPTPIDTPNTSRTPTPPVTPDTSDTVITPPETVLSTLCPSTKPPETPKSTVNSEVEIACHTTNSSTTITTAKSPTIDLSQRTPSRETSRISESEKPPSEVSATLITQTEVSCLTEVSTEPSQTEPTSPPSVSFVSIEPPSTVETTTIKVVPIKDSSTWSGPIKPPPTISSQSTVKTEPTKTPSTSFETIKTPATWSGPIRPPSTVIPASTIKTVSTTTISSTSTVTPTLPTKASPMLISQTEVNEGSTSAELSVISREPPTEVSSQKPSSLQITPSSTVASILAAQTESSVATVSVVSTEMVLPPPRQSPREPQTPQSSESTDSSSSIDIDAPKTATPIVETSEIAVELPPGSHVVIPPPDENIANSPEDSEISTSTTSAEEEDENDEEVDNGKDKKPDRYDDDANGGEGGGSQSHHTEGKSCKCCNCCRRFFSKRRKFRTSPRKGCLDRITEESDMENGMVRNETQKDGFRGADFESEMMKNKFGKNSGRRNELGRANLKQLGDNFERLETLFAMNQKTMDVTPRNESLCTVVRYTDFDDRTSAGFIDTLGIQSSTLGKRMDSKNVVSGDAGDAKPKTKSRLKSHSKANESSCSSIQSGSSKSGTKSKFANSPVSETPEAFFAYQKQNIHLAYKVDSMSTRLKLTENELEQYKRGYQHLLREQKCAESFSETIAALQEHNAMLLRRIADLSSKQYSWDNVAIIGALNEKDEALRNGSRTITDGALPTAYDFQSRKIANLEVLIANLASQNGSNFCNYIKWKHTILSYQRKIEKCKQMLRQPRDDIDLPTKPSNYASKDEWVEYANKAQNVASEARLTLKKQIFCQKLTDTEYSRVFSENGFLQNKLEAYAAVQKQFLDQHFDPSLRTQIELLTADVQKYKLQVEEYEKANKELLKQNEEVLNEMKIYKEKLKSEQQGENANQLSLKTAEKIKQQNIDLAKELEAQRSEARRLTNQLMYSNYSVEQYKFKLQQAKREATNRYSSDGHNSHQSDEIPLAKVDSSVDRTNRGQLGNDSVAISQIKRLCRTVQLELKGMTRSVWSVKSGDKEYLQNKLEKVHRFIDEIRENLNKAVDDVRSDRYGPKGIRDQDPGLHKICVQVALRGIGSLDFEELIYLQYAIYKASVRLRGGMKKKGYIKWGSASANSVLNENYSGSGVERMHQLERDMNKTREILRYLKRHSKEKE